jgi:PAS domain S-box-containing protein
MNSKSGNLKNDINKKQEVNLEHENNFKNDIPALQKELILIQRELEEKNRELHLLKQKIADLLVKNNEIYEHSPAGYITFDSNGTILGLNQSAAEQLSISKEQLINKSFIDFIASEYRSKFSMHLDNVFKYKIRHSCEVKIERMDKSTFYAFLESVPSNRNVISEASCKTAIIDITSLKVSEESLKESEIRFQNLANTAPVLIWVTDANALFTFINNFWLEYTGRTPGHELGMGWLEGIHPDDLNNFMNIYKSSFDARRHFEVEFRMKRNDGSFRWMACKGVPRFQTDGCFAGYIGSCTDINDQKIIEETVKKFNEELKSLNANKDKFFSIIAHDLKSPLSGLLGFTEILVNEFDDLTTEEVKEFIGHSHQAAINMNALLENLLEWSRIQTGNFALETSNVNVESVFDNMISLFNQYARNKKIRLEKKVDANLQVLADENMFKTIMRNLVSNGIKFTREGGCVHLTAIPNERFVNIVVQDSGIGLSQENINKLFRIDVNYTTPGTNKERGTGLGLVLCKELVEKNGGNIWVESEVGKGTKFNFSLPKKEN